MRRVGSGLGIRCPLLGEGERALWRHGGGHRAPGETGEVGDSGGGVDGAACTGDEASADMVCAGRCSSASKHVELWEGKTNPKSSVRLKCVTLTAHTHTLLTLKHNWVSTHIQD